MAKTLSKKNAIYLSGCSFFNLLFYIVLEDIKYPAVSSPSKPYGRKTTPLFDFQPNGKMIENPIFLLDNLSMNNYILWEQDHFKVN
jgi:hypothetical protein